MSELKHIDIKIADRTYPLKVKAQDEQHVKSAADRINAQLKGLTEKYDARDMQDYLAMYLMLQMTQSDAMPQPIQEFDYSGHLKKINTDLDDLLK